MVHALLHVCQVLLTLMIDMLRRVLVWTEEASQAAREATASGDGSCAPLPPFFDTFQVCFCVCAQRQRGQHEGHVGLHWQAALCVCVCVCVCARDQRWQGLAGSLCMCA